MNDCLLSEQCFYVTMVDEASDWIGFREIPPSTA